MENWHCVDELLDPGEARADRKQILKSIVYSLHTL